MTRHLTIALAVLVLFPGILPGQDAKVEEAEKAVETARSAVDAAESKIAAQYSLLRCDFDFIRSDAWVRLRGPVLLGVKVAAEECATDTSLDPEVQVRAELAKSGLLAKITQDLLSAEIAGILQADRNAASGDLIQTALERLFPEQQFEPCWPSLSEKLDTVKDLAAAHDALDQAVIARKALDAVQGDPGAPPGMVLVPKGRFKFGPWTGWEGDLEGARIPNKVKTVRMQGFFIDVTEVTNAAFREFLAGLGGKKRVNDFLPTGFSVTEDGTVVGPAGKDTFPVVGVTLSAAMAYAKSVGKRLPTEAEWEMAARGEDGLLYPWGPDLDESAANWKGRGLRGPAAAGAHPKDKSPFGALDMAGNVSELTLNLDGRRPVKGKLEATDSVVTRGGNFEEGSEALKTGYRWVLPADGGRSEAVGFRCVMSEKGWSSK